MEFKLPTSYLPENIRSAVRFTVIGTTGMFVQTWCFMAALLLLDHPEKGAVLYYVAFGIGYILEMIPNYLCTNWYTFRTKPDIKNAGGFLVARAFNLAIQLGLLPLMTRFPLSTKISNSAARCQNCICRFLARSRSLL